MALGRPVSIALIIVVAALLLAGMTLAEQLLASYAGDQDGRITSVAIMATLSLLRAGTVFLSAAAIVAVLLSAGVGAAADRQESSRWAFVTYCLAVTLAGAVAIEVCSRAGFYQRHGDYPLAVMERIAELKTAHARRQALLSMQQAARQFETEHGTGIRLARSLWSRVHAALYSDIGKDLLRSLQIEYEKSFHELVAAIRAAQARAVVLYIPTADSVDTRRLSVCRTFFRDLSRRHGVDYLDTTDACFHFPVSQWTLLPLDRHLSRFGNQIMAQELSVYLDRRADYRSPVRFSERERPRLLGDLTPSQSTIETIKPALPYHLVTNRQGLRMEYSLTFPKQQQRILILGDSFTYGPHLHNHETFSALLDARYSDREVINAGKVGYTITSELGLFRERARFSEPDIVVLQVVDNDLFGLLYFLQNHFDREGRVHYPTLLEKDFYARLKLR